MITTRDIWEEDTGIVIHCISKTLAPNVLFDLEFRKRYPETVNQLRDIDVQEGKAYLTQHWNGKSFIHMVTKDDHLDPSNEDYLRSCLEYAKVIIDGRFEGPIRMPLLESGKKGLHIAVVKEILDKTLGEDKYIIHLTEKDLAYIRFQKGGEDEVTTDTVEVEEESEEVEEVKEKKKRRWFRRRREY